MKILHVSHGGLPDPRIEKTAFTMKKEGHQLYFLGGQSTRSQSTGPFNHVRTLSLGNDLDVVFNPFVKGKWLKKIQKVNPDVIHAHNVIVTNWLIDIDYPVIYDDHEYWSKQTFKYRERALPRGLASRPLIYAIPKWERRILQNFPVLTVSENIAKEHRRIASHVGVTKNYPTLFEAEQLQNPDDRIGNVYVGGDFNLPKFQPHRNMTGLKDVLDFDILSGMDHETLMEKLTHYRFGLTPWRQHPFHQYCEPNKHYEYLIAGLQVILTSTLEHPLKDDPYVHSFETYDEITELLNQVKVVDGSKIMKHSMERYIWEKQEHVIHKAYEIALK